MTMSSRFHVRMLSIVGLLVLGVAHNAAAQSAAFRGLGDLPGGNFGSRGYAVCGDGSTIVGRASVVDGVEACRWVSEGEPEGLGRLGHSVGWSYALAVSNDGGVIVGFAPNNGGGSQPFRWTADEGMVSLGFLPGGGTYTTKANGISSDGSVIVGAGDSSAAYQQAFRWTADEGMVPLPDLYGGGDMPSIRNLCGRERHRRSGHGRGRNRGHDVDRR